MLFKGLLSLAVIGMLINTVNSMETTKEDMITSDQTKVIIQETKEKYNKTPIEHKECLEQAKGLLEHGNYSKQRLTEALDYFGYDEEAIQYAIDTIYK